MLPIKDSHPANIFPFWTVGIIALNVLVFFQEITSPNIDAFIAQWALIPALVNFSDTNTLIPFITSQFLHGGIMHIVSNMLFLWIFGDNVEAHFGRIFFPFVYIISGIVGGLAQYIIAPGSEIPMLGASGAVAGVLGAYMVLFGHHTVKTFIPFLGLFGLVEIPAIFMLGYWFVTQILAGVGSLGATDSGGVAYLAHVGGFITGLIFALLTKNKHNTSATYA